MKVKRKKSLISRIKSGFWIIVDRVLQGLEKIWLLLKSKKLKRQEAQAPIFIIGSPRSGTTLLYQFFIRYLSVGYFSNFMSNIFHAPLLAYKIQRRFLKKSIDFKSYHGRTKGLSGPSEAGLFWYRWFPRGRYVYSDGNTLTQKAVKELRNVIHHLTIIINKPIVFKNTYNSMRIKALAEIFPNACFIICRRDPLDVAQSLLLSRQSALDCKDQWWSVPPQEIDEIEKHHYCDQVVEQVYFIERQIEQDRFESGGGHFFVVDYQRLCTNPAKVLTEVVSFLQDCNLDVSANDVLSIEPFSYSHGKKVVDEEYEKMQKRVDELWV